MRANLGRRARVTWAVVAAVAAAAGCTATREEPPEVGAGGSANTGPTRTAPTAAPSAGSVRVSFADEREGIGASGFAPVLGEWAVRQDPTAPSPPLVYAQVGTNNVVPPEQDAGRLFQEDYSEFLDSIKAFQVFPSTIYEGGTYGDVDVSVAFKPISGKVDQAGGLVFRVEGPADYYIWRCNVLEQNCEMFIYEEGKRRTFFEAAAKLKVGEWRRIRVVAEGKRIRGYLDDRLLMDKTDPTFSAGRVGLWTKADAVTNFDDFEVAPLP